MVSLPYFNQEMLMIRPTSSSAPDDEQLARLDNAAFVEAVHDRGLGYDLSTMTRRSMLGLAGGLGALVLVGCRSSSTGAGPAPASSSANSPATCSPAINSETNGPYPADGSNGLEVRTVSGIVRNDITSSFGGATGRADGVPLTATFTVTDLNCHPLPGAALYIWHCDRSGQYSMYSQGVTDQNYLRGVAETDSTGAVTFTTIFPACYSGRWPHIHFEVYHSVADATSGSGTVIKTSQLAFPQAVCDTVYATDGYQQSVNNLGRVTLATDTVFGDDSGAHQLGAVTGNVSTGYQVRLSVPVDPSATETSGPNAGGGGAPPGGGRGGPGGGAPPSGGWGGPPTG